MFTSHPRKSLSSVAQRTDETCSAQPHSWDLPLRASLILSLTLSLTLNLNAQESLGAPLPELGYNLAHNLPHAHRFQEGVLIDLRDVSSVKYLRNKLWIRAKHEGRDAAFPQSIQAKLWVSIPRELSGKELAIDTVIAPAGPGQLVDIFVGKRKIKSVVFKNTGWQSVRAEVPAELASEGIKRLKFHFRRRHEIKQGGKTPAGFRVVRLGLASQPKLPLDEPVLRKLLKRGDDSGVSLTSGQGLDYYIVPSKRAHMLKGKAQGGSVEVWAQADKRAPKMLKRVSGKFKVSLKAFADKPTRLMLRAGGDAVTLNAQLGGRARAVEPEVNRPKYVVFWLIDTLRADKLKFYQAPNSNGRPKVKTPNLSALAKESVVFEPFYVQGNESKSSHASLFTGFYPARHGVYTHKAKLASQFTTIAEMFKGLKYHTGGYVSNGYVSEKWNYAQGFRTFQNFIREGKANNALAVFKAAKRFIQKRKNKPFYLYLGTSDPHVTYRRHKQFINEYSPRSYKGKYMKYISGGALGKLKERKDPPPEKDRKRIEALYENEIAFNDLYFGKLVKLLKSEGIYDDTMIIVSADHGDEFWEHGSCGHGHSLYQELVSVPLMIRWPKSMKAGRFEAGADGVDLLPTLATLMGTSVKGGGLQGRDLSAQLSVDDAYPQAVMASKGKEQFTLAVGPAKVIYRGPGAISVFNLKSDHREQTDVLSSHPITALSALDPLLLYLTQPDSWSKSKLGAPNALRAGFPTSVPQ